MIKLKHILKEDEVSDKFGDVYFGEDPKIAKMQGKKVENDTKFEKQLRKLIYSWILKSTDKFADKLWEKYPLLKKAALRFPSVLRPSTPDGTTIYRGFVLDNVSDYKNLIKKNKSNFEKIKYKGEVWYVTELKYKPHRKIQSWTSSYTIASKTFGVNYSMYVTEQNDEFLFNQRLMDLIADGGIDRKEYEILHFGQKYSSPVYLYLGSKIFNRLGLEQI